MREIPFVADEYYHIYAHSVGDLELFKNARDFERFIVTLFLANGKKDIPRLDRSSDLNRVWVIRDGKINLGDPLVDIVGFCVMPNHFHFLLGERKDGNISIFMHRVLVSYAKYFNLKYERRGHVFESKFNAKHIVDDNYLLRVSSYIHLNPKDLRAYKRKEQDYPWSTFQDYVKENRWGKLLCTNPINDHFSNPREHYNFVSGARSDIIDSEFDFKRTRLT